MNLIGKPLLVATGATGLGFGTSTSLGAAGVGFKWAVVGWGANFRGAAVATPVRSVVTVNATVIARGVSSDKPWDCDIHPNTLESEENGNPSITLAATGGGDVSQVWLAGFRVPVLPSGVQY